MNCPSCGKPVPDGAAICPGCDHIIDDSFLASDDVNDSDDLTPAGQPGFDSTHIGEAPQRPVERTVIRAAPQEKTRKGPPPTRRAEPEEVDEPSPPPRRVAPSYRPDEGSAIAEPGEVLDEIRAFFTGLSFSDRLAFVGAGVVALSTLLPWKDTHSEDEVIGIVTLGFVAFLGALLALGALTVRVRQMLPSVSALVPWFVQLASVGFCIVWEIVFIRMSWDGRKVQSLTGDGLRNMSQPAFGVYFALAFSLVALAGTILSLKERDR